MFCSYVEVFFNVFAVALKCFCHVEEKVAGQSKYNFSTMYCNNLHFFGQSVSCQNAPLGGSCACKLHFVLALCILALYSGRFPRLHVALHALAQGAGRIKI